MIRKSAVVAVLHVCCIAHSRQPQGTISLRIILNLVINVIVKAMNPFCCDLCLPCLITLLSSLLNALYPEHIIFTQKTILYML